MTRVKRLYSASDVAPSALYAKRTIDEEQVYPVLVSELGGLLVTQGMSVPAHDQQVIDESDPNNVTITYKLSGSIVATKTISVSGTTTTITVA
jgi:hypothetical protein